MKVNARLDGTSSEIDWQLVAQASGSSLCRLYQASHAKRAAKLVRREELAGNPLAIGSGDRRASRATFVGSVAATRKLMDGLVGAKASTTIKSITSARQ